MRISRVRLFNFANFSDVDVETGDSIVIVGENKVGKSNFIRALQLILDPGLSERDRQLGLEHFWDGLGAEKLGETIEVSVDLTDFTDDPRLMAHLNDCVIHPGPPMVARLTYRFQPKAGLTKAPESLRDYEYVIFGGNDPEMRVGGSLRRMLPLDVQVALRDAEKDLASWRHSPLRPLIEDLATSLDEDAREEIQQQVDAAQLELASHDEVIKAAERIGERLVALAGKQHAVPLDLGLAPTRVDALLRSLRLLIDDGARGIGDASLGTANLIFLALKSLELDRLVSDGDRDHTFLVVEEPEAHLHPHVQRLVYRYFLGTGTKGDGELPPLTTILTTHSPQIASVAPIRSIVLLRHDASAGKTVAVSTANAPFARRDEEDLQRYIDVTRGEIFFSRGVILVEGDAERFLIPAFAEALGIPLDMLGITVCSVGGTNFTPYVKLLGPHGLDIPHVILTDRDPVNGRPPLVHRRLANVLDVVEPDDDHSVWSVDDVLGRAGELGYFVNENTLEPELFTGGLAESMQQVIERELNLKKTSLGDLQCWVDDPDALDEDRLLGMIERIGKGRFAQALANSVTEHNCPEYIRAALKHIRDAVV
ncbi:AAA family ATPase [Stenotrophomonas maltophilia]|nr:AAA family ATPase [Stenotrophomonas maltophilia]MBN7828665.1 AAA family ATPase [Stenotrophomonas maltophilia]MBN7833320.1 AAA family ATPase [Stenotrophomonas maltophilia]MBN7856889.1 AAA family ATPase [Stenotrophomonas maltophilia]MBN7917456.1 AAA family ATPase [Stenotrophomonas maltophilia]MBO2844921.1 AAA family ATPase [Stenotrophomonas maltophilia]